MGAPVYLFILLIYLFRVHRAALFNRTKVVEFLLEKEARLNARDSEGRSPFLNAVAAGHVDLARVLLKRGADISAADLLMKTCVHIAVENEHLEMLAMLLETRPGANNLSKKDLLDRVPLHYAAKTKDIKVTKHSRYYSQNILQLWPVNKLKEST